MLKVFYLMRILQMCVEHCLLLCAIIWVGNWLFGLRCFTQMYLITVPQIINICEVFETLQLKSTNFYSWGFYSLFISMHVFIISNVSVVFLSEKAFSLLKTFKEVISELQGEFFSKVLPTTKCNVLQVSKVDEFSEHIFSCNGRWFPFENHQDFCVVSHSW